MVQANQLAFGIAEFRLCQEVGTCQVWDGTLQEVLDSSWDRVFRQYHRRSPSGEYNP